MTMAVVKRRGCFVICPAVLVPTPVDVGRCHLLRATRRPRSELPTTCPRSSARTPVSTHVLPMNVVLRLHCLTSACITMGGAWIS